MSDIIKRHTECEIKCKLCSQRMLESDGCLCSHVIYRVKITERIKYGEDEYDFDERCHNCGAKLEEYHHYGCDVERCLVCGNQLISCEFENVSGVE